MLFVSIAPNVSFLTQNLAQNFSPHTTKEYQPQFFTLVNTDFVWSNYVLRKLFFEVLAALLT